MTAADRAHAKRTEKALQQQKVWRIERVKGDKACAKRLTAITETDIGGYIWDVQSIPMTQSYQIIWWGWDD